jgi:pyruvate dehydrogenase E2 component (dihydrolipoamide acetyltransferase)
LNSNDLLTEAARRVRRFEEGASRLGESGKIARASSAAVPAPTGSRPKLTPNYAGSQVEPAARRLAKEADIDLAQLRGSGPGGRITEQDVRAAIGGSSS